MLEEGYCAYESNVQDAFAAQNPTASSPSQIRGRQNIWEDEYDDDEKLHPSDPLPLGDHTILFVLAAITAMSIFIQQRKRRQSSSAKTLLTTLAFIFIEPSEIDVVPAPIDSVDATSAIIFFAKYKRGGL